MSNQIRFDEVSGAYTDGTNYVKAPLIRKYAREKMGQTQLRGRLAREWISAYFLDTYGVSADVA